MQKLREREDREKEREANRWEREERQKERMDRFLLKEQEEHAKVRTAIVLRMG